jgi:hypothetical protein
MQTRCSIIRWAILLSLVAILLQIANARADAAAEYGVKAGFVYNFTKFIEWPPTAFATSTDPLQLCVIGDRPLDGKLQLLDQRRTQDRDIVIALNPPMRDWPSCHILYLGGGEASWLKRVLRTLNGVPVLTVSDMPGFAQQGGIIELYIEDSRVQFAINLNAARRVALKLSSQLLRLAKIVE